MCEAEPVIDHLCRGCLNEAVKESAALNLAIRAFKRKFGVPSFAINELAGRELGNRRHPSKRP